MIRPKLKFVYSPDVENLAQHRPAEPENVGILFQLFIGSDDGAEGAESFDVMVCTPDWFKQTLSGDDMISGAHYLIVYEYSYTRVISFIEKFLQHCHAETWEEVAHKVGQLGKWEFADYTDV